MIKLFKEIIPVNLYFYASKVSAYPRGKKESSDLLHYKKIYYYFNSEINEDYQ